MCLWLGLTNNLPTHLVNYVILVNRGILYWHPETASSNVSFGTDKIRDKEKKLKMKNPANFDWEYWQMEATQKEKIKIAN